MRRLLALLACQQVCAHVRLRRQDQDVGGARAVVGGEDSDVEQGIPKYAHWTAQKGLYNGAQAATQRSTAQASDLSRMVGVLEQDLLAAKMRQAELTASVAAMPAPTTPAPSAEQGAMDLLPSFSPNSVPFMVRELAAARLKIAIPTYVHALANASEDLAAQDAAEVGAQLGEKIAQVAAPRAAEAAIAQLVDMACQVASGPSAQAAYQAATAATNLTEAGTLARGQAETSVLPGCSAELSQVAADIVLAAAKKAEGTAANASIAAARESAARLVQPAAQRAAVAENEHLTDTATPQVLLWAGDVAVQTYKAETDSGAKEAAISTEASRLARIMDAAERIVDAAEHLASQAALHALVADVDMHHRIKTEVDRQAPGAFRAAVENLVLPADAA